MSVLLVDRVVMSNPGQPEYGIMGSYHPQSVTEENTNLALLLQNWPLDEDYYSPFMVDSSVPGIKYVYKIIKVERKANRNIYTLEVQLTDSSFIIQEGSRRYMMIYDFPGRDQVIPPAPDMTNYSLDADIDECDLPTND